VFEKELSSELCLGNRGWVTTIEKSAEPEEKPPLKID